MCLGSRPGTVRRRAGCGFEPLQPGPCTLRPPQPSLSPRRPCSSPRSMRSPRFWAPAVPLQHRTQLLGTMGNGACSRRGAVGMPSGVEETPGTPFPGSSPAHPRAGAAAHPPHHAVAAVFSRVSRRGGEALLRMHPSADFCLSPTMVSPGHRVGEEFCKHADPPCPCLDKGSTGTLPRVSKSLCLPQITLPAEQAGATPVELERSPPHGAPSPAPSPGT